MDTATLHASSLRKARERGTAVTFVLELSSVDPETEELSVPVRTTVTGYAVEIPDEPTAYLGTELIPSIVATLFFAPDKLGQVPALDSVVMWAGKERTVAKVLPYRPAGTIVAAKVFLK